MTALEHTAPASNYRDASRYEAERKAVFGRSWLFMGHQSDLAREGDVVVLRTPGGVENIELVAVRYIALE